MDKCYKVFLAFLVLLIVPALVIGGEKKKKDTDSKYPYLDRSLPVAWYVPNSTLHKLRTTNSLG